MKLSKDDELLKDALLSEVAGNIATLQGKGQTYVNGKKVTDDELIDESINDLSQLSDLVKGEA